MNQLINQSFYKIVILGAGFAGLGMAAQLKKAGINDFIVLEKKSAIGGVWRDNIYPGAACDTQSHLYCYEFFPHLRVSRLYADQPEFIHYMNELIHEFDLTQHIVLNAEISSANWDEIQLKWDFKINNTIDISAKYFIPAWGQLNTPNIPDFKGFEKFKGQSFHSAQWDKQVSLNGKNVASIGAAASAVQYIPKIAPNVKNLTIFQRSANWVLPRQQVVFTEEELDNFEKKPSDFMRSRDALFEIREQGFSVLAQGSEAQEKGALEAKKYLEDTIPDPVLRQKLTPDYEFGCKRILRTSDYFPTLLLPNVYLDTTPIQEFYEEGIITHDGKQHPIDVVIFGTGFKSQAFHGNLNIAGLNKETLSHSWRDGAAAYLGISVPNFPNLFLLYGPNTNLNHNSVLLMIELQQNYIIQAIEKMERNDIQSIVVPKVTFQQYNDELQINLKETAFSTSCSSWYKNAKGKIINNWSGTVAEYQSLVEKFDIDDYTVI